MTLIFRQHALRRMFERGISADEVETALASGATIETYPDDTPYASQLTLGHAGPRRLHVVHADLPTTDERIVITVYEPDELVWLADWRTRRKPKE